MLKRNVMTETKPRLWPMIPMHGYGSSTAHKKMPMECLGHVYHSLPFFDDYRLLLTLLVHYGELQTL